MLLEASLIGCIDDPLKPVVGSDADRPDVGAIKLQWLGITALVDDLFGGFFLLCLRHVYVSMRKKGVREHPL